MSDKTMFKAGLLACCVLAAISGGAGAAERGLSGQDLVYSYDEMFDFDIDAYLAKNAPHLSRQSEVISHWAGYSGISPKVLIALMEQQSGAITRKHAAADAMRRPFGRLAQGNDFNAQTREVAQALREALYEQDGPNAKGAVTLARANPLQALFERSGANESSAKLSGDGEFQLVYGRLFNEPRTAQAPSARFAKAGPDVQPLSPNGLLQFPFPRGARWHVGGAHTNTGSGNYPMSSLDMSLGGGWGSNQNNTWVSASANGSFKRHSSCFAEIVHSGGWSTTYYHLMNIQYGTGANVSSNTAIANPANTQAQALCDGGSSTGPHEHWSLKQNGSFYHLNGAYVSGYRITATGTSYDTNCSRFYLTKNGTNTCYGWYTNPGH
ncbi:MAG: M23 family metallopeptidase [Lysobacter sp.]